MSRLTFPAATLVVAAALTGCSTTKPPPDSATVPPPPQKSAATSSTDVGVDAFHKICLATAPSFADAPEAAKKYGVSGLTAGVNSTGMTKDSSLSVQLKPGIECAVTTTSRPGDAVAKQFMSVVTAATGTKAEQTPFAAKLGANAFIFHHDRNGGEAFVMVKR